MGQKIGFFPCIFFVANGYFLTATCQKPYWNYFLAPLYVYTVRLDQKSPLWIFLIKKLKSLWFYWYWSPRWDNKYAPQLHYSHNSCSGSLAFHERKLKLMKKWMVHLRKIYQRRFCAQAIKSLDEILWLYKPLCLASLVVFSWWTSFILLRTTETNSLAKSVFAIFCLIFLCLCLFNFSIKA